MYVYENLSGSENEEVEYVPNYSKAHTYTQVYTRKGKPKETNITSRNETNLPIKQ